MKANIIQSTAWVDKNGKVIEALGNPLPIYSITKTFIAAAILAMKIDLQERISKWIEKTVCPRASDITLEQLLNHTSGIRDYGNNPTYINAVKMHQPAWSNGEFAEHTLHHPLLFEPGARFSYANSGYWLVSQIAQRESGLDFDGFIRRYITQPLELTKTHAAHGIFSGELPEYPAEWVWHGLLISSAEDVARFMASKLVVPLAQHLVKVPGIHPFWNSPHYGYGLMVEPGVRIGHNGGGPKYSAACYRFLSPDFTGCVLMESDQDEAAFKHLLTLFEMRRSILNHSKGENTTVLPKNSQDL